MIKEVEGNLLTYPGIQVVAHQTNCLGVMGGGIAKQIKDMNPKMFKKYYKYCKEKDKLALGTIQCLSTDDGKQIIANLFGEYSFTESIAPYEEGGKPRHTDYDALKEALFRLHTFMVINDYTTVGVPDHIGCGLAGGDWEGVVLPMVKNEFEEDGLITLYIVKYKP